MKKNNMIWIVALMMLVLLTQNVFADTGLTVSISKYEPFPATPGQTVKVWLLLQNTGDTDAKNVNVQLVPQSPFTVYNDESSKNISLLGAHKDYLIDFNLKVDQNAVEGINILKVQYNYEGLLVQEKNLEIQVQAKDSTLTIESVKMEPEEISPGSDGTLKITVKNTAPSTVTDLSIKLQLQALVGSTLVDLPFAPMDSGTERRIYMLESGKSAEFTYSLRAYPDATSKVYKIPFSLTYFDSLGAQQNKTDFIGVVVNGDPDLALLIDDTTLSMQQRTGEIKLKVINKGVSDMKFLNVILQESNDYEVLSNSETTYIGNLVSDDYQTADYNLNIISKENKITVPVKVQYRDANNKYYDELYNVELNLVDSSKLNPKKSGATWIILIIIIAIAFGVWRYFKNKNKKNKKGQIYQ